MKKQPEQQSFRRKNRKEELKKQFYKSKEQSRAEYEEQVEKVAVPSAYGKLFRNVSLLILAGALVVLGIFMGRELLLDRQSKEKVAALQDFVSGAPGGEAVATTETPDLPQTERAPEAETVESTSATSLSPEQQESPSAAPLSPERQEKYWQLYQRNNDFCGWLTIPETVVDYPVMHRSDDNDFYLSHNFDREADVNGLLVLDKRCGADGQEDHLLIHGHNMKSGFMFGGLKNYKDPAYCAAHPFIRYDSLFNTRTYEIFAVFLSSTNLADTQDFHYYDYIQIDSEESFDAYVSSVKQQSLYPIDVTVEYGDALLTLSTCDYTKDNGRLVIVARSR